MRGMRRRGLVALVWVLACVLLLPKARHLESVLRVAARVDGSESAMVEEQLAQRFQSPFAHAVVLVASGVPSPLEPAGRIVLRTLVDSVQAMDGVTGILSYLDGREPLFVGQGGTFVVVGLENERQPDVLLDNLRR